MDLLKINVKNHFESFCKLSKFNGMAIKFQKLCCPRKAKTSTCGIPAIDLLAILKMESNSILIQFDTVGRIFECGQTR